MEISLQKAQTEACKQIHEMQIRAFAELLNKYKDYSTNPAAETIEKIEQRMAQEFTDYHFICLDGNHIGVIRIMKLKDDTCRISPMFIEPEFQGKGYAQQAILKAEILYSKAKHWTLDTIKQEAKLCYLYEKMGYRATGKEETIKDGMTLIYYAKDAISLLF